MADRYQVIHKLGEHLASGQNCLDGLFFVVTAGVSCVYEDGGDVKGDVKLRFGNTFDHWLQTFLEGLLLLRRKCDCLGG